MTKKEFEELVLREGYSKPTLVQFEPQSRSDMHRHDAVSFVFVVNGEFILNRAEGASRYLPGETCLLDKEVEHAEQAGAEGATILVARK